MDPEKFIHSGKDAYGYAITENLAVSISKSTYPMTWEKSEQYCSSMINAGISGRMPNSEELNELHKLVMVGSMMVNLMYANLYELCNYRLRDHSSDGWRYIWANTVIKGEDSHKLYYSRGVVHKDVQSDKEGYVIPFYDISKS